MNALSDPLFVAVAPAPAGPPSISSAHFAPLDAAYLEYCRRRAAGEVIDKAAFCSQFPDVQGLLHFLVNADEFLEASPELLIDSPTSWPEVGAAWEGFELLAELGRGAFARVYLAREPALGERLVALKCTRYASDEAATLGRLQHPHVVPIHYIRQVPDSNLTIVCMPYLGHATLQHVCTQLHAQAQPARQAKDILEKCRDKRLAPGAPAAELSSGSYLDGVRWIAARIAGALAYLHSEGICHRDLKPSNILLQPDGSPRLLDFNLSGAASAPQTGLGGTLHYMAPEQLEALRDGMAVTLTPQVDVFALGVILYEWLTGSHPCAPLPTGDNKALHRHLLSRHHGDAPSWPALPSLEPSLTQLIERCLRRCPDERPSAAEIATILSGQLRPAARLWRGLRQRPLLALAAAALVAISFGLGVYTVANQPPRAQAAYERGWQAYRAGKYQQALQHFDDATAHGGNTAEYYFARARTCQRLGNDNKEFFDLAFANYKQAYEHRPQGSYKAAMAYCLQRRQQFVGAEDYYQQALGQGFATPAIYHNLACLYWDKSELKKAREFLELALALDRDYAPAHCQLATVLTQEFRNERQLQKEAPGDDKAMPDLLRRALNHMQRGLPKIEAAPAPQAAEAARTFAWAIPYDASQADRALAWLERAVAAGSSLKTLKLNPAFQPLLNEPRFLALRQADPAPPASSWVRIVDPVGD